MQSETPDFAPGPPPGELEKNIRVFFIQAHSVDDVKKMT